MDLNTVSAPRQVDLKAGGGQLGQPLSAVGRKQTLCVLLNEFRDHWPGLHTGQGRQLAQTERNSVVLR